MERRADCIQKEVTFNSLVLKRGRFPDERALGGKLSFKACTYGEDLSADCFL
jgi:hypothetical protein